MVELTISPDDAEQRLDRFLRKLMAEAPLSLIHSLLRKKQVRVDGAVGQANQRLVPGQVVELPFDRERFAALCGSRRAAPRTAPRSERAPALDVLHRDPDLLVVDKPAGLAVHGGSGQHDDLTRRVRALLQGGPVSHTFRPSAAHRLDRSTSGLVVFGCSARGLRAATEAFRDGLATKTYRAVVHGVPSPDHGTIDLPLDTADRGRAAPRARIEESGQRAVTHYRSLASDGHRTLLEIDLETGRTHQIRAHFAALGHPLCGDERYGAPAERSLARGRVALHAYELELRAWPDRPPLRCRAPWPDDLRSAYSWSAC